MKHSKKETGIQINGFEMDSSSNQRSIRRGPGAILLLRLVSLGCSLNLLHSPLLGTGEVSIQATNSNASNPLVYTRLRHDDNYLQIYRAYQLEHPHEEMEIQLKVNESLDDSNNNEMRQNVYTYYKNEQIDANNVTLDDLILEALDRTYKTRLVPVHIYNYDNPDDRRRASDPKLISEPKCKRHLSYLRSKLNQRFTGAPIGPELAAFFDSYASEEPGLLFGNYHWTGNWRQCYKRQIFDISNNDIIPGEVTNFKGRYCVASIRSHNWEHKIELKTKSLLEGGNYFKYPEQAHDYGRFFRIQIGICLPESCDSQTIDTQRELIRQLAMHKLQEPLKSYKLVDLFCLPDETSELRKLEPNAWLLILLTLAWCSAIILATLYDLKLQRQNRAALSSSSSSSSSSSAAAQKPSNVGPKSVLDKLVSALSLLRNYHRLTETKSLEQQAPTKQQVMTNGSGHELKATAAAADGGIMRPAGPEAGPKLAPNDLLFLNAFKVISMPCILFGHTGMLSIMLDRFALDYEALENTALIHFNISSVFFVDWYFVITGFLASYLTFVTRKVERNTPFQWAYTIFHRYWRLAPMYILLFWFSQSLFQHTASGPVWDYGTSNMTQRSICRRESWIWPLALIPNLHPIHEECIMPAWYIANDMQFYIITPFILVGLSRWPIFGWLATVGGIWMSMLAIMFRYITDPRAQPLELMRPRNDAYMRNNWDMHPTYIYPQYRIPAYLIGLLAGHYTYMVLSGKWRSPLYKYQGGEAGNSNHGEKQGSKQQQLKSDHSKGYPNDAKKHHLGDTYRWLLRAFVCFSGLQIVISMMFASYFISDFFPRSLEPHVKYFTAMVYGTSHAQTALGLAMIFVGLMMGQFKWLRSFLSHPFFTLISRINYFVFLVQVEVIYWLQQSSERVSDFSVRDTFKNWITLAAICYPMAALVTLWLELPLANLEREFIGSWMASKAHAGQGPKLATTQTGGSAGKLIITNDKAAAPPADKMDFYGQLVESEKLSNDKRSEKSKRRDHEGDGKTNTRKQEDSRLEVRIN